MRKTMKKNHEKSHEKGHEKNPHKNNYKGKGESSAVAYQYYSCLINSQELNRITCKFLRAVENCSRLILHRFLRKPKASCTARTSPLLASNILLDVFLLLDVIFQQRWVLFI